MPRSAYEFKDIGFDDTALLAEWHRIYAAAFPCDDEREPLEFFRNILLLNQNADLQRRFGPYREFIIAMRDAQTGEIVAGLNFGVTTSDAHRKAGLAGSVHIIFLFIAPKYRNQINARCRFEETITEHALAAITAFGQAPGEIATFFEVNNPLDMSEAELVSDHANSGTDTYHRYASWLKFGWPLDFRYVQPALSSEKEPVRFLHLFYEGPGVRKSVASDVLWRHLYSFVSLSVLKGQDASLDPDFKKMDALLKARPDVGFLGEDDTDIVRIRAVDDARSRLRRADATRGTCGDKPLVFPVFTAAYARPRWHRRMVSALANFFYRASRNLYGRFEHNHVRMAMIDLAALVAALTAAGLSLRFDFSLLHASSAELASLSNEINVTLVVGAVDSILFAAYFIYIASRSFVSWRRSRLGPSLSGISANMKSRSDSTEGDEAAREWLEAALLERAALLDACGYLVDDSVDPELRGKRLRQLSRYASSVYSEQVLDGVDEKFAAREYGRLDKSLSSFRPGFWGASFRNCPDRVFASLILPVVLPTAQTALDLDAPVIDGVRARKLEGRRTDAAPQSDIPCLLVLRQLPSAPLAGKKASPRLERQLDLLLTTLLHLADMLEKLAYGDDILTGLERVSILSIASNADSRKLLEGFGFKLLQSGSENFAPRENDDRSHFSVYALAVERAGRDAETERFLQLLAQLQRARYARGAQ